MAFSFLFFWGGGGGGLVKRVCSHLASLVQFKLLVL